MWNDPELDLLNKRIGNARQARQNSETEWSQEYLDIVLSTLLRKANRLN